MTSYRPICDTWILARSKVAYYGAYPAGFLGRARQLLGVGIDAPVLHVCGGKVKDYPFYGIGENDRTVDIDPSLAPDYLMDVREMGTEKGDTFPSPFISGPIEYVGKALDLDSAHPDLVQRQAFARANPWPAILIDRPYTEEDAGHYMEGDGAAWLPDLNDLLKRALSIVRPGGRVGVLDYFVPRPPKVGVRFVACVGVIVGFGNRGRFYTVFETDPNVGKKKPEAPEEIEDETAPEEKKPKKKTSTSTPLGFTPPVPSATPPAATDSPGDAAIGGF